MADRDLPILTQKTVNPSDELGEIIRGLRRPQKTLSPKFFYDDRGSQLFEDITRLPEYYLTNAELAIMRDHIRDIADLVGPQASLIEYGSGSSMKTRILLENLRDLAVYVPVDISREHLLAAANSLASDFPDLEILPVAADFTQPFDLPNPKVMPLRNIVYFPGSTIGNFAPYAANRLLNVMHQEAGQDGALLIGVDLQKDKKTLEDAYNDSEDVTAEFNLNVLRRLNREFDADFDLDQFEHRAIYNDDHGRVEMYLVSQLPQVVSISGEMISFRENETILTEHSHKHTLGGFQNMAERAGFIVHTVWTDEEELFSVQYCLRV